MAILAMPSQNPELKRFGVRLWQAIYWRHDRSHENQIWTEESFRAVAGGENADAG